MLSTASTVWGQNCLGLENQEILNVAKKVDFEKLNYVRIKGGVVSCAPGFKFVQLRDTETFILVPTEYQGRVIDFKALLPKSFGGKYVLNPTRLTSKIACVGGTGKPCEHSRIAKTQVGCQQCTGVKWTGAAIASDKAIIIPAYSERRS